MVTIRLEKGAWEFDEGESLGPPGGFGEVFKGTGAIGPVAIKRLKLTAGAAAHREMNIGRALAERELEHVVPVLDYGQDADTDRYYLVMPICERSLQDELALAGRMSWDDVRLAALHILAGLMEVGDLVHRDLKPGNVLWHEGRWRVADFGIAKFVEDSTSLETLRTSLTPLYGAPEQWLGERPTHATDVYALGCIIHAMMNGRPPYVGDADGVREAHLKAAPPPLEGADPRLSGLVQHMLRKSAATRPSLIRCSAVIEAIGKSSPRARDAALAEAGHSVAREEAAAEARQRAAATARQERDNLMVEAGRELIGIMGRLFDEIEASAESARRLDLGVALGPARLSYGTPQPAQKGQLLGERSDQSGWDVATFAFLTLRAGIERYSAQDPDHYNFCTTLVFARTPEDPDFRWREISFFNWAKANPALEQPIALNPAARDFGLALSNVVSGWEVAYGPLPIDGEDEGAFQDRWLRLFARAAQRKLRPPNQMPLPPNFFD